MPTTWSMPDVFWFAAAVADAVTVGETVATCGHRFLSVQRVGHRLGQFEAAGVAAAIRRGRHER